MRGLALITSIRGVAGPGEVETESMRVSENDGKGRSFSKTTDKSICSKTSSGMRMLSRGLELRGGVPELSFSGGRIWQTCGACLRALEKREALLSVRMRLRDEVMDLAFGVRVAAKPMSSGSVMTCWTAWMIGCSSTEGSVLTNGWLSRRRIECDCGGVLGELEVSLDWEESTDGLRMAIAREFGWSEPVDLRLVRPITSRDFLREA